MRIQSFMGTVGARTTMFICIEIFFLYIYKYLGRHRPSLLSFIQFTKVSNRYLILCGNATSDRNYSYLISSENLFSEFSPN